MGFFDFLTKPLNAGDSDPKKRKPPVEAGPEPMDGADFVSPPEPPDVIDAVPAAGDPTLAPLGKRSSYMSQIANLRDQVATEIAQAQLAKSGIRSNDYSLLKEAVLKRVPLGDYAAIARNLEKHARGIGPAGGIDPSKLPSFQKLQEAVRGFKQESLSQPVKQTQAAVTREMATTDLPNIDRKIQSVKEQLAKIPEQKAYSASEAEDKTIAKQEKTLTSYLQALTQQQLKAQSDVKVKPLPDAYPDMEAKRAQALNGNIKSVFTGAGLSKKVVAEGLADLRDGARQKFGNEFDLDQPADPRAALYQMAMIGDPSGELWSEYDTLFGRLNGGEDGAYERATGLSASDASPVSKERRSTQTELSIAENQRKKQEVRELLESEEMMSFGSIMALVLLSLAVGPQLALFAFSNAKKTGSLKGQLAELDEEGKNLEWQRRYEQERKDNLRSMVAQTMYRSQERRSDRRADFVNRWALMQERAANELKQKEVGENDQDLKDLTDSMKEYQRLSASKAAAMDFEGATEAIEAAEGILPLIAKRRALLKAEREGKIVINPDGTVQPVQAGGN